MVQSIHCDGIVDPVAHICPRSDRAVAGSVSPHFMRPAHILTFIDRRQKSVASIAHLCRSWAHYDYHELGGNLCRTRPDAGAIQDATASISAVCSDSHSERCKAVVKRPVSLIVAAVDGNRHVQAHTMRPDRVRLHTQCASCQEVMTLYALHTVRRPKRINALRWVEMHHAKATANGYRRGAGVVALCFEFGRQKQHTQQGKACD